MQKTKRLKCLAAVGAAVLCCGSEAMMAATSPTLGTADGYSVLAGSAVTNTGTTSINGDVGISPGIGSPPHYSGFGTVILGGALHDADVPAQNAMADQAAAYTSLDANACTFTYPGAFGELAGQNLVPGTYCATSFHLTSGTLTLTGTSSDVWVFKSASDLVITGGASANVVSPSCYVWWRVVSTASFDANSSLIGNILADTSITFAAGASLSGRAFARTAAVTLSSNQVITGCFAALTPTPTATPTVTMTPTVTPTPNLTPTVTPTPSLSPTPTPTPPFSGSAVPGLSGRAQLMMAAFLALAGFIAVRRFAA